MLKPQRSFVEVYDREEPRAYFRALEPLAYRQPDVVAGFLAERGPAIAAALGRRRLRVLDFGCGYGALGAVAGHCLAMTDLYAYFAEDPEGDAVAADGAFFARHRRRDQGPEIGGLDIAGNAVAYAEACGTIHRGFTENLVEGPPGPALAAFFEEVDLVVETGAVYGHVPACYDRLFAASGRRPWLLFGPRGDAATDALWSLLQGHGYRVETVSRAPRRYRRLADATERGDSEANMRALGRDPARLIRQGWFVNPLVLARPAGAVEALAIDALLY